MLNEHYDGDGEIVFKHACKLGCEGIVSKRLGSPYKSGRSADWIKVKNPAAPAVKHEADEDWDTLCGAVGKMLGSRPYSRCDASFRWAMAK